MSNGPAELQIKEAKYTGDHPAWASAAAERAGQHQCAWLVLSHLILPQRSPVTLLFHTAPARVQLGARIHHCRPRRYSRISHLMRP